MARILVIEDSAALAQVYHEYLIADGHTVDHAASVAAAISTLASATPDAIMLDLQLPDGSGLEVLQSLRRTETATPVIVATATGSITVDVNAMREGAYDFLVKPINAERLLFAFRNCLLHRQIAQSVPPLPPPVDQGHFCGFIGNSPAMQAVYRTVLSAAKSKASIFITGESGTGKEVCADAVHRNSTRAGRTLVALNCAAIPKDLIESEIFGHVKGAFTGATANRVGAAVQADGGTLFLDEICEMPLDLQAKLLRFIQTGTVTPVGGATVQTVDVRFVCATNRDPAAEVLAGRFREDLFYRLHVIPIALPPLRERGQDIPRLAKHFLHAMAAEEGRSFADFDAGAMAILQGHPWPGNVRQLQNVVRNAVVLNDSDRITAAMIAAALGDPHPSVGAYSGPDPRQAITPAKGPAFPATVRPLAEIERDAIAAALHLADNNVVRAAAMLEISPSTIYRKMARWGEDVPMTASP